MDTLKEVISLKRIISLAGYALVFALLGAGVGACSSSSGNGSEVAAEPSGATGIEVITVEKGRLVSSLSMPGELVSFQQVDLYAREASFVRSIRVDVGSEVQKGQVLAVLEAPEITSRLSGAQSRLKSAEAVYIASKAGYERLLETSKTPGTISPNDLDQAASKMNSDLAQLESAKAATKEISNTLDYLTIRAPFGGVITARNVNPGAYVGSAGRGSADPLFVLQEQKHLRLVIFIPEAYSAFVKVGDEIKFSIKALPQQPFMAKVKRMAGALDSKLRSQRVEMDVINEDGKLLPGMIAQVSIPLVGSENTFIVPKTAIVSSQENVFVIRIENDTAKWVNVETGRTAEGRTEIFGPVRDGDVLVKKATDEIRNGAAVKGIEK